MMRAYSTSLLLLTLIGLSACKKDEQNPTSKIRQRVFTNGKEIKDEAVKNRFIQQSSVSFVLPTTTLSADDVIRFVKPDTVLIGTNIIRYSVSRNKDQYLFYSPFMMPVADRNDFFRLMLKYTSPLLPVPDYLSYSYVAQHVVVGYNAGNNIRLAVLHYRFKQALPGNNRYSDKSGRVFNEFKEATIASVKAGDTLAVQESSREIPTQ
ncbi:hypothetical protein [Hymenobacter cavernae]|uniref:Lipoprotein n=1 Tax=Hymenobacter cavernae TaxID=2044852 RepID=A0ABQ1UBL9_9BACT|nr:hypothetical protein [Hymenobacter cavernae]GGF13867.1 hypothetical protein GCM10011383_26400 [Hymenobacter cavernae]